MSRDNFNKTLGLGGSVNGVNGMLNFSKHDIIFLYFLENRLNPILVGLSDGR